MLSWYKMSREGLIRQGLRWFVARVTRPFKTFNVENRAHRVISKEKPEPAPWYPGNLEDIQRALEAEPDLVEKLSKKDSDLDKRLRDVFVSSQGPTEDVFLERRHDPKRPLPQERGLVPDFEYGLKEPEVVKYGKTTVKHVLKFVSDHQVDPEVNNSTKIALDYKLKEDDVKTILKYFKTFEMYVPGDAKTSAKFAGPATMRKMLMDQKLQIEQRDSPQQPEKLPKKKEKELEFK